MKVVLDTSVLIASFYQPLRGASFSKQVYDYITQENKIYVSDKIMEEFQKKCLSKLGLSLDLVEKLKNVIEQNAHLIKIGNKKIGTYSGLRDPADAHILDLCKKVEANILLTWDKDLLSLSKKQEPRILTPRQYWNELSLL